ncbi:MGMT family protein [uncultured Oscillibacter sp.]|uniref:MGMT family protein n=1 Tax=uncultured Oscillibacter sp. TaxID=876091 RepID=UPI002627A849|nr:MGMT family protein [uncultured Oscillibacter sp.]
MADYEYIPATKKTAYLDKQMFATIICMIPAGKLTTLDAICEMWARRKGADYCEIENGGIMPFDKRMFWMATDVQRIDFITELKDYGKADTDSLIPYWRLISLRGMLIDYGNYFDKETQKTLLEREGHVIEQPDHNKRLYRVQNYKAALFDLNKLIIKE